MNEKFLPQVITALGVLGLPLNASSRDVEMTYQRLNANEKSFEKKEQYTMAYKCLRHVVDSLNDDEVIPNHFNYLIPLAHYYPYSESNVGFLGVLPKNRAGFLKELYRYIETKPPVATLNNHFAIEHLTNHTGNDLLLDEKNTFYIRVSVALDEDDSARAIFSRNYADFCAWGNSSRMEIFLDLDEAIKHCSYDTRVSSHYFDCFQGGFLIDENNEWHQVPECIPCYVVYQVSNITPRHFFFALLSNPINLLPCVTAYSTNNINTFTSEQMNDLVNLYDSGNSYVENVKSFSKELAEHSDKKKTQKIMELGALLKQKPLSLTHEYLLDFLTKQVEESCKKYKVNYWFFPRTHAVKAKDTVLKMNATKKMEDKIDLLIQLYSYLKVNKSKELVRDIKKILLDVFSVLSKSLPTSSIILIRIKLYLKEQNLLHPYKRSPFGEDTKRFTIEINDADRLTAIDTFKGWKKSRLVEAEQVTSSNCYTM